MSDSDDVRAAFEAYDRAFLASDMDALHHCLLWPCAFLLDGRVQLFDQFPIRPSDLMQRKGWVSTAGAEIDVIAVSADKAHVALRNVLRLRADGSVIERVSAFYAFTRTPEGWKIFAISGIELPA